MPTSRSTSWFITISPRLETDVDLEVVSTMVATWPNRHFVREVGSNGLHPHFHIVVWGDKQESQESVRKRFLRSIAKDIPDDEKKYFLNVKPVDDRNKLIGSYLQKDAFVQVLDSTIPDADLTSLKELYINHPVKTKTKTRNLALVGLADEIIKFATAEDYDVTDRNQFKDIIQKMYQSGYRMTHALRSIKTIYLEVCMIKGKIIQSDELFGY